ncbi:MAG: hypothetical protein KJ902_04400, partial [Candidatus Omnitrophica bacterium]|nr:hypothetical protein [Candidatus Omnitrophota bacterium]
SVLLLSIIFLAVSALYVSSQKFYYKAANESIIAEELSYAIEHISKTVMRGMGTGASVDVSAGGVLSIDINNNASLDSSNYADIDVYEYELVSGSLRYVDAGTSTVLEDLCQKITVTNATFSTDSGNSNVLTISLEGSYGNETLELHFSAHPRLTTFN